MQGRTFSVFSPEDQLVYLCLLGTKHCWAQLALITCLAELLLNETEIYWDLVSQLAEEYKCRRMVYIGLLPAQKIYRVHLPVDVNAVVAEDKKALSWCGNILGLIQETGGRTGLGDRGGLDERFSLFRLQVGDSHVDAARCLLRMVFCPSKSEWKAFRLPSGLVFGYWLARPFRVL